MDILFVQGVSGALGFLKFFQMLLSCCPRGATASERREFLQSQSESSLELNCPAREAKLAHSARPRMLRTVASLRLTGAGKPRFSSQSQIAHFCPSPSVLTQCALCDKEMGPHNSPCFPAQLPPEDSSKAHPSKGATVASISRAKARPPWEGLPSAPPSHPPTKPSSPRKSPAQEHHTFQVRSEITSLGPAQHRAVDTCSGCWRCNQASENPMINTKPGVGKLL